MSLFHTNIRAGQKCTHVCLLALFAISVLVNAAPTEAQTKAYVANGTSNLVTVLDTAAVAELRTIYVGNGPARVAITRDGTRAYVTNTGSDSVSVIDTGSDSVVDTIAVEGSPAAIAVTPGGDRVYVAVSGGLIRAISTALKTILATITVDGSVSEIAITPDGTLAYVAAGTVSVIDTATNTVVRSFLPEAVATPDVSNSAVGMAISPDGTRAYVPVVTYYFGNTFSAGGGVAVVDTATNMVVQTVGLGSLPGSIALTPDGTRAYVGIQSIWVDTGYGAGFFPGRSVAVIDTSDNSTLGWIDLGADGSNWTQQNTAAGIAVTPDRSGVYVSIPRISAVKAINAGTNVVNQTVPVALEPSGLAIVPDDSVAMTPYPIDAVDDGTAPAVPSTGGTAVANVLGNDKLGGGPATLTNVTLSLVSSTNAGVTLNNATGSVSVAAGTAVGLYSLVYRICETAIPANCDSATVTVTVRAPYVIDAMNDSGTSLTGGGVAVANVLANDKLGTAAATTANVILTRGSSTNAGVTLNLATGSVSVAAGTAAGTYTLSYRICETASPSNCDTASVRVTVSAIVIDAVDDKPAKASSKRAGTVLASVLANDKLGNAAATTANVTLSLVSLTPANNMIRLDLSDGSVDVLGRTNSGIYTLVYGICETGNLTNCDQATVTIELSGSL